MARSSNLNESSPDPGDAAAVVGGASIHVGKHQSVVTDFVRRYREPLVQHPPAFVQVSLSSAVDDPVRRAEAAWYVDRSREAADWNPDRIATFGGAPRLDVRLPRALAEKRIGRDATGDVDPSRDYEYPNWDAVEAGADEFAEFVADRTASPR